LLIGSLHELCALEGCVLSDPGVGCGDLVGEGGSGENLGDEIVRKERDGGDELIKLVGCGRRLGCWRCLLSLRGCCRWRSCGLVASIKAECADGDTDGKESGEGLVIVPDAQALSFIGTSFGRVRFRTAESIHGGASSPNTVPKCFRVGKSGRAGAGAVAVR
jgi:hypothetical protein